MSCNPNECDPMESTPRCHDCVTPEDERRYTEGICFDGAAILHDGRPLPIDEVVGRLNCYAECKEERNTLRARVAELEKAGDAMNGVPCNHKGCLSHITHPCEGCGRIGGKLREAGDE